MKELPENHPTRIKFEKLCDLAEEFDLALTFENGKCYLRDYAIGQEGSYLLQDYEEVKPKFHNCSINTSFPPVFDYKIVEK